jgi:hypothetical protein
VREKYCWLVAGGWFVLREKYCWLAADKPSEQGVHPALICEQGDGYNKPVSYVNATLLVSSIGMNLSLFT